MKTHTPWLALALSISTLTSLIPFAAWSQACSVQSGATITPVIELYTSEGCSSCPPADKWVSTLRTATQAQGGSQNAPVVQAFHVGYWDYIGWTDRFAQPSHTSRQRQVSAWQNSGTIYTPQLVRNAVDLRSWDAKSALASQEPAALTLTLKQDKPDAYTLAVHSSKPDATLGAWSAYWTVTEHGHSSNVKSGENKGEFLQHDFVVRQYQALGDFSGNRQLQLQSIPKDPAHPRQINVVVYHKATGKPLQAVSLRC